MKLRRHVIISEVLVERAKWLMRERGCESFSELFSVLIREEHDRRFCRGETTHEYKKRVPEMIQEEERREQAALNDHRDNIEKEERAKLSSAAPAPSPGAANPPPVVPAARPAPTTRYPTSPRKKKPL